LIENIILSILIFVGIEDKLEMHFLLLY